jgi:hypothetical protein
MLRKILVACGGFVVLATGCASQPQMVLGSLPDPAASPSRTYTQGISRYSAGRSGLSIVSPLIRPFPSMPRMRSAAFGEPGWVPAIGVSDRWTCLVIHHSASDRASPQAMDNAHRQRGWDELGYHFVIGNGIGYPDGQVYIGSRWVKQKHGAHCKVPGNYYNEHGVGICLMGDLEEHPPTERQMQSLAQLVMFLEGQCAFGQDKVLTHGGITGKTRCPGRYFSLNDLYRRVNVPMYARR